MTYEPLEDSRGCGPADLRAHMERDGFLFLRGLLPEEPLRALRDEILAIGRSLGWCEDHDHARAPARLEGEPAWFEMYDRLQCLEAFHALAHRPELLATAEAVVGEKVLVHPRNIARITFPDAAHFTTPPHQDHPLIQGTPQTYTAWIPLVDMPEEVGGLPVLVGSHRAGLLPVHRAVGPGGLGVSWEGLGLDWSWSPMRTGDVLLFHSLTVHRAMPNLSRSSLRISVDYRYQGWSQPIVADSLEPHYGRLAWDEITANWSDRTLCRYWERSPLNLGERRADIMTPE